MTALAGGDPLDLPLDRFLNLVYYWLVKDADEKSMKKLDTKLWMPPKGVVAPRESPWSAESETASFRGFVAQMKGASSPVANPAR